jgi:hypothetical protein
MSGWDVSSTPKWGPQDGPEETQAFPGQGDGSRDFGQDLGPQDFGRGGPSSPPAGFPEAGGGYPGESAAGGPPPEFFGQEYGQDHELGPGGFPQRTPGRSFEDLPRRESQGRHSSAPGGYGQDNGYGADSAYGHENSGYGQETGYGQDSGFGQDDPFGQDRGFGQDNGFGQDRGFGQDSGFGQDWGGGGGGAEAPEAWGAGGGQQSDGGWGRAAGRSAAPWEERPQPDAGYPGLDGQQDFGQQDFGRQDYTRQAPRPDFGAQDYDGHQGLGQPGVGPGESLGFDRGDRDMAARMDPALQDFFAPQRGGTGGYPGQGPGRPGDRDPRNRPPADGWENPGRLRTGTGPRPASRGPRRDDDDEPRRGLGMRGLIAIGVVVAIIIVAGVVLLTHKSGGSSPTASNTPAAGATAPSAKPTATGKGSAGTAPGAGASGGAGATATAAYTLSTPSTAGGYPLGQDPSFLTTATNTAKQISAAVTSGGGGTVKGNPVSAAYRLPAAQVITFVGYQGTFTPAKVLTILATLGSNPNTYPAGPNGGVLGCANTKDTPSGAVCVWATASTLGVTEFFDANGPETLNAAQSKGATDTVKLRADVEKKKA